MTDTATSHQSERPLDVSSLAQFLHETNLNQSEFLSSLTSIQCEILNHDWSFQSREHQRPPEGPWQYWLFLAGRGAGKTRAGAEWVRNKVKSGCMRIGMIAPTAADVRDVMIEGGSGVLSVGWDGDQTNAGAHMGRPVYEPSKRRVTWANGAIASLYSAEEPDRLRGPQHDALWCDELAAWQYAQEAWDMAMFGLRLGVNPQAMISTTPRPIPIVRELMRMSKLDPPLTVVTRASTYSNRANLADSFITTIIAKYEGTRLGRQELMGDIVEEAEGALWSRATIEKCYARDKQPPDMRRIVVAVDPATTSKATSNLTGIVVAGVGADGLGYVLADISGRYTPDEWGRVAVKAYQDFKADSIVAEGNQGGEMVVFTIKTVSENVPVKIVHASRSKQARAEPVAALYEQGRVKHTQTFAEMEDQMCTWEPLSGDPSPDRLDAVVWAITNLMLTEVNVPFVVPFVTGSIRNIPGQHTTQPSSPYRGW